MTSSRNEAAAQAEVRAANADVMRNVVIALLVLVAFFAAYRFAQASWGSPRAGSVNVGANTGAGTGAGASAGAGAGGAGAAACSCCAAGASGGSGASASGTRGAATVSDGIQRISVEVSGNYNPSTIELKSGIPAEITFGQSSGCTAVVQSSDLGFQEDLTSGPKTVKLPALKPGTYGFACGMNMVQGQIVVK